MSTTSKTWSPTKYQFLYRHKSGIYYARLSVAGKKTWRSLKTEVLSVAKSLIDELLAAEAVRKERAPGAIFVEKITGEEAIIARKEELDKDPSIKASTRKYVKEILAALARSWPQLMTNELRNITEEQCSEWAGRNHSSMSATRFNATVSELRNIFKIAIKRGARRTNPAAELKRTKVKTKDLSSRLPTKDLFARWVAEIRTAGGRFSAACADLVEFLAYTGVRIGEAKWIEWRHVDLERRTILIQGAPELGTKNGRYRHIDLIPAAKTLLERMSKARTDFRPAALALNVHEAQKAMDRAAEVVGMERITHHDLRHYFATICIESGVDIPTTAAWLGHQDGGALAMRVYGHLRREHSKAAAAKVNFAA